MSQFLRPRPFSIISSSSISGLANLFAVFKYSTFKCIMPQMKAKQCIEAFPTTRIHRSTITLFAFKKESCNDIKRKYTATNHESSKIIKPLSKILQCSEEEAYNLYQNHDHLAELHIQDLETRVEELNLYGIENVSIKQNIWILFFNTYQLSSRLELLKKWKFTDINNAVGILQLPFIKLKKHTFRAEKDFEFLDGQNKITYFSSFTKCGEKEACDLFLKYPFMMTIKLGAFKAILQMAKEMGVLKEDLLSDPWLFKYNPQFIANRILFLDEIDAKEKCKVIKPWMLRCPQSTLDRYFELKDENLAALGSYTNLKDLLSNELDLSDAEVEEMFLKHPPLAKISYSKAKEMIDFLKSEGFGSRMIHQVPRVLCHKQATLLARMLELKKVNPRMMSLQNLCRNKKDYLAFLNKLCFKPTNAEGLSWKLRKSWDFICVEDWDIESQFQEILRPPLASVVVFEGDYAAQEYDTTEHLSHMGTIAEFVKERLCTYRHRHTRCPSHFGHTHPAHRPTCLSGGKRKRLRRNK